MFKIVFDSTPIKCQLDVNDIVTQISQPLKSKKPIPVDKLKFQFEKANDTMTFKFEDKKIPQNIRQMLEQRELEFLYELQKEKQDYYVRLLSNMKYTINCIIKQDDKYIPMRKKIKTNIDFSSLDSVKLHDLFPDDHDDEQYSNEKEKCGVCMGNLTANDLGVVKCGHIFCYECVKPFINVHKKCPMCQIAIKEEELYKVLNSQEIKESYKWEDMLNDDSDDEIENKIMNQINNKKQLKDESDDDQEQLKDESDNDSTVQASKMIGGDKNIHKPDIDEFKKEVKSIIGNKEYINVPFSFVPIKFKALSVRFSDNLGIFLDGKKISMGDFKSIAQTKNIKLFANMTLYAVVNTNALQKQNITVRLRINTISITSMNDKILQMFNVTNQNTSSYEIIKKYPTKKNTVVNNVMQIMKNGFANTK